MTTLPTMATPLIPPFDLHQVVWVIRDGGAPIYTICGFCAGKKRIVGADNTDMRCPDCRGTGTLLAGQRWEWSVRPPLTIGLIRCEWTGERVEWKFMAYEPGIGSGSLYDLETTFATSEEAQAACDERNEAEMRADAREAQEERYG